MVQYTVIMTNILFLVSGEENLGLTLKMIDVGSCADFVLPARLSASVGGFHWRLSPISLP
jgi:hypothetical protein